MKRRNFFKLTGTSALAAVATNVFGQNSAGSVSGRNSLTNPFETKGKWYKAALHAHTTSSDGDVDVPTRLKQYRDKGFDVVAIADQ